MSNPVGIVRQNAVAVGGFAPNVGRSGRLCRSPKADIAGNLASGKAPSGGTHRPLVLSPVAKHMPDMVSGLARCFIIRMMYQC